MLKNLRSKLFMMVLGALSFHSSTSAAPGCHGRLLNPLTDICWQCIFPISVAGVPVSSPGQTPNGDVQPPPVCTCPAPPPLFVRVGVGVSFWEPVRISEVVRQPLCSPTLGGVQLGSINASRGSNNVRFNDAGEAFYHVHWLEYPIFDWLNLSQTFGPNCQTPVAFDALYLTELDPLWDSDELSFLVNPEAALFANPAAQQLCAADSTKAAATQFGFDALFWCSGSQGSVYPLSGSHANHTGGVDTALALTHTIAFKLHRQLLAFDTSSPAAMCGPVPQPVLRKKQYKAHLVYPIPWIANAVGFGTPSLTWGSGKEFPYTGEDFSYLVWRKKICCAP